jgi:hypothetical protein
VLSDDKPAKAPVAVEKLLGASREEIRRQFGKPDRTDTDLDSFFKAGLTMDYDNAERVTRVIASHYVSGDYFKGKVLGIGLGDTKKACIASWGNPVDTEVRPVAYNLTTWEHKDYVLVLDIWSFDGKDDKFGEYKKDTVKRITIARKP